MIKAALVPAIAAGLILPQPALYVPSKPALVKAQNIEFSKNMLLGMPFTMGMLTKQNDPISYVSFAEASATTLTMPTHQAGDILFMWGVRSSSGTFAAPPAGWIALYTDTTTYPTFQVRFCYQVATTGSTTSGTWTGASKLNCFVYRGVSSVGTVSVAYRSGTSWTWPTLTQQSPGSSWVAGFTYSSNLTNFPLPAGRTVRRSGSLSTVDLWDTDGRVSSFTPDTMTGSTGNGWFVAIELKD